MFAVIVVRSLESWSLIGGWLDGLKDQGPTGNFIVRSLLSPILPLVIGVAALYLVFEGRKERSSKGKPDADRLGPDAPSGSGISNLSNFGNPVVTVPVTVYPPAPPPPLPPPPVPIPQDAGRPFIEMMKVRRHFVSTTQHGHIFSIRDSKYYARPAILVPFYYDLERSTSKTTIHLRASIVSRNKNGLGESRQLRLHLGLRNQQITYS